MKQISKEVGDVVDVILVTGAGNMTKELFNQSVIQSASVTNKEVVMSSDGYAMIEIDGNAEIVIPADVFGFEDHEHPYHGVIVKSGYDHPLDKLLKEFESNNMKYIDIDFEKKFKTSHQPWKKSNQRHPAFKRR